MANINRGNTTGLSLMFNDREASIIGKALRIMNKRSKFGTLTKSSFVRDILIRESEKIIKKGKKQ